ncbi:MAG: ABC-type Fe3+-hydroxamate transport system, periplasmic component [Sedimentibacter sp.]|nr:ABC-type Fe3+-hydroxamate transport system, periplasmic component [Sedimentibacter sp.]
MKQKLTLIIIMMIVLASLAACTGKGQEPAQQEQQETEQNQPKVNLPTKDRAGNEITIPEEINKIISISPSNTEMIVEMGYGDKLVAVDKYSGDIEGIPENIPFFDIMNPDVEQLVALEPDIIYATGMSMSDGNDPFKPIKDLGITVAYIPTSDSIEGIYDDIIFIADSLKVSDKGQNLVNNMKEKINEFKEFSSTIETKKTVYFEIAGAPKIYSFGSGVFLNEMIEIIGAENILADQEKWIAVSEEIVVAANPDVILTNVDYIENAVEQIKNRNGWEDVTAIKNNDVYYIDRDASSLSNHNIVTALDQMAQAIYPEIYKK